jgi:hypothetical protein
VSRLVLAAALVAAAVVVALLVQRRRPSGDRPPTFHVPATLDRTEFDRPEAPWLVAVFTSASCDTCAAVLDNARQLADDAVVVQELEARVDEAVHDRYHVDAVPLAVLVDGNGIVRAHYFGPTSSAELRSALAALRDRDG